MIRAIVFQERLNFLSRGPAWIVGVLILTALGYAGWSGGQWRDAQLESLQDFAAKKNESLIQWRAKLAEVESGAIEAGPYDANPMSINFPAILPPASLGDFAVGHADLHPASAEVSPWRNGASVFGRYQFDNPTTLASSSFDIAFVIIVLIPMLMIAVSFDVLASERRRGSLAMILASPVPVASLVWGRLAIRNGLVWLLATVMMGVLAFMHDAGGDRYARFGLWLIVSLCYGGVWLAAIAYCVARFRTPAGTAGVLVGLWLLFTLALPSAIATMAEGFYPTPSRLAYLSEIREAQGETNRSLASLTDQFLMDHPDLTVGDEAVPSYFRAALLSNEAARDSTQPILLAYEAARQGRDNTVRWSQYLSPSIVTQRLLTMAAGADLDRQHRFQSQVLNALSELASAVGPAIVSRSRISTRDFDQLDHFEFDDVGLRAMAAKAALPVLFLLILSLIVGALAHRRMTQQEFVA